MRESQLFLPFEAPQHGLGRLFFAILSPPEAAMQIAECVQFLRAEHGLKGRPIGPDRLHISLHGLGDHPRLPKALVEQARGAGASVAMPPFDVVFDRAVSFARKNKKPPVVLRASGDVTPLITFHRRLGDAMKKAGLGRRVASRFTPHMTLIYDDRVVKERAIEAVRLTVRDFALVHSLVGRSRYIELARWPLHE
jgi:2'-5' RNA ligase